MTQPHYIDRSSAVADLRLCIAVASQSQPGWREVWQDALKSLTEAPMEAVAWRLENLILPGVTFTEDRRYAEALRDDRYEGRVTTIVQALAVIPTEAAVTEYDGPELALEDAEKYGFGFIVDGRRVAPERVTLRHGPTEGGEGHELPALP